MIYPTQGEHVNHYTIDVVYHQKEKHENFRIQCSFAANFSELYFLLVIIFKLIVFNYHFHLEQKIVIENSYFNLKAFNKWTV